MQSVTGRSQVTQRRKRIATMFGIGAGGGAAAGLTSFGLRRGLTHYRRLRGPQSFQTPRGVKGRAPREMTLPKVKVKPAARVGSRMGRMFGGMRRGLGRALRFASGVGRFVT